jgi:hypothetical protein
MHLSITLYEESSQYLEEEEEEEEPRNLRIYKNLVGTNVSHVQTV